MFSRLGLFCLLYECHWVNSHELHLFKTVCLLVNFTWKCFNTLWPNSIRPRQSRDDSSSRETYREPFTTSKGIYNSSGNETTFYLGFFVFLVDVTSIFRYIWFVTDKQPVVFHIHIVYRLYLFNVSTFPQTFESRWYSTTKSFTVLYN
jgi:hypothetical protein